MPQLQTLEALNFDNTFTAELPGDKAIGNGTRQVHGAFYSYVTPTPTGTEPSTVACAPEVANLIGLDPEECERPEFPLIFSGNAPLPGSNPYAQCYGGHQFGSWAGQLGDGRAICLGEILNPATGLRWELQLKGAGKTPYSRFADGRAVLRSSIREFVASEAMAALGVPTTRALSLVRTGDEVVRDMFYTGNPQLEPGAVVCRVARSFIRFGTFQLPVSRGDDQVELVRTLADYVIRHFYPECSSTHDKDNANKYAKFLVAVAERTGLLVSEWHRVGFVHGVLNTDNMSILGDTIDYGPYGWLERFDPNFTPNTTDLPGRRYSFQSQPEIGQWNVLQLAQALVAAGLMNEEAAAEGISAYGQSLKRNYEDSMARKFGLKAMDRELANEFLKHMYDDSADYTNTFRALSSVLGTPLNGDEDGSIPSALAEAIELDGLTDERQEAWRAWVRRYRAVLRAQGWKDDSERTSIQNTANPALIPRNHVLVGIIGQANDGNYEPLQAYMSALRHPYDANGLDPAWKEPAPKQSRLGVELLSCSS